jgi:hypothetical protein
MHLVLVLVFTVILNPEHLNTSKTLVSAEHVK